MEFIFPHIAKIYIQIAYIVYIYSLQNLFPFCNVTCGNFSPPCDLTLNKGQVEIEFQLKCEMWEETANCCNLFYKVIFSKNGMIKGLRSQ